MTNSDIRVFKYSFPIDDKIFIPLPKGYKILKIDKQGRDNCMWCLVDKENPTEKQTFYIHGTGHPIPDDGRKFIATFFDFPFVWHVFQPETQADKE